MPQKRQTKLLCLLFVLLLFPAGVAYGQAADKSGTAGHVVNVKVLTMKGCRATQPTIDLVKTVAREMHVDIDLAVTVVNTSEQAKEERFLGSPTVQVNGLDIEPSARKFHSFGVT